MKDFYPSVTRVLHEWRCKLYFNRLDLEMHFSGRMHSKGEIEYSLLASPMEFLVYILKDTKFWTCESFCCIFNIPMDFLIPCFVNLKKSCTFITLCYNLTWYELILTLALCYFIWLQFHHVLLNFFNSTLKCIIYFGLWKFQVTRKTNNLNG